MAAAELGLELAEEPTPSLLPLSEMGGNEERKPANDQHPADATSTEKSELRTYFPGVTDDKVFCISCGSHGHRSAACSLQTCELCGAGNSSHTKFGCPSRCRWCCTPGHAEEACKSKEAQAKKLAAQAPPRKRGDEEPRPPVPPTCLFCRADTGHISGVCPTLWRTIVPDTTHPRIAKRLCMACYVCGDGTHFGGDCPKNTGRHVSGRPYSRQDDIWSRAYCLQFTDLDEPIVRTNLTTTDPDNLETAEPAELVGARAVAEAMLSQKDKKTTAGKNQEKTLTKRQANNQAHTQAHKKAPGKPKQKLPQQTQQQQQQKPKQKLPQQTQQQQQQKPKQKQKQKQKQTQLQSTLPTRPVAANTQPAVPADSARKKPAETTGKQPQDASQTQNAQPPQQTARARRDQRRRAQNKPKGGGDAKVATDVDKESGQGGKQRKRNHRPRQGARQGSQSGQNGQNGQGGGQGSGQGGGQGGPS